MRQGGRGRSRCRRILGLLEHKLNLRHLVVPAAIAQETEQRVIDGEGLFLLAQHAVRLGCLLAQLHQLIGFFRRQGIQVDAIHRLVEIDGRGAQIALGAVALTERVEARERVIGIVQQRLELANRVIPAPLFLIEPAQEVAGIRSIESAFDDLLAEVDSIGETPLALKGLCLAQNARNLAGRNTFTRSWRCPASSCTCCRKSRAWITSPNRFARATHITHHASSTSAYIA